MDKVLTKFEPVIGLEVHAQLLTKSKLFCRCSTKFGNPQNENICPVCTGQPGALPVLNAYAVDFAIRAGLATHCTIAPKSVFARKNYFYPDLPKGYQISQFDLPICEKGYVDITFDNQPKRIGITRIHMEEDAGKSIHDMHHPDYSHVDLNRSSVPLIEIVSEPDIRSAEEASEYLKTLRNILVYLEVCDGNMQEGSFRCDANISIRPKGQEKFGTRTELKNLNSFNAVERSIRYEIMRQAKVIENGEAVIQQTRLWNDDKQETSAMRGKEEAHDYRYFPDPDLLPLNVDTTWIEKVKSSLPELGKSKAARFVADYHIPEYDAEVLTQEKEMADFFEAAVGIHKSPKKISNWIMTELMRDLNKENLTISESKVTPAHLGKLVAMIDDGTISGKIAKDVFADMFSSGKMPDLITEEKGLVQVSDTSEIEPIIDEIINNNADNVAKYKSGKTNVFGFFVGQVMKATKGQANPKVVNELLKKKLG